MTRQVCILTHEALKVCAKFGIQLKQATELVLKYIKANIGTHN